MSQTSLPSALNPVEIVRQLSDMKLSNNQIMFTLLQTFAPGLTDSDLTIHEKILMTLISVSNNQEDLLKSLAPLGFEVNCCCILCQGKNVDITIPVHSHDGKIRTVHVVGRFSSI